MAEVAELLTAAGFAFLPKGLAAALAATGASRFFATQL
jgi:hypothetical protein